ncbi:MAG: hypothetical protein K2Q18_05585 [Bdellovibrionales bacterium]|nr:hypothetical protein [Bdellovibrionales bacterium]
MNFETEYKNITFKISLEKETYSDPSHLMGDKFNRLPNQTMIEIKKGALGPYNVLLTSIENGIEYIHYLSGVLLTTNADELLDELGEYLEQEHILDDIVSIRKKYAIDPGPAWR